MSTRAVYTFKDERQEHSVYKHHDGYPGGAAEFIRKAKANAWPLPRFEADEFAAAFVAANKDQPGGVRLTTGPDAHGDLAYAYTITKHGQTLWVEFGDFAGTLEEMAGKWPCPWTKEPVA